MPKISSRSREVTERIQRREPFQTYGALHAVTSYQGRGVLPELDNDSEVSLLDAEYVVYSYETPIAWWTPGRGWTKPNIRYSLTTSHHQGRVYGLSGTVHRPVAGRKMRDGAGRVEASEPGMGMAANMYPQG